MKAKDVLSDEMFVAQLQGLCKKNLPTALSDAADQCGIFLDSESVPFFRVDASQNDARRTLAIGAKTKDDHGNTILVVASSVLGDHADSLRTTLGIRKLDEVGERKLTEYTIIQAAVNLVLQSINGLSERNIKEIQDTFTNLYI